MSDNKTVRNDENAETFIGGIGDPDKRDDCRRLLAMFSEVTGREPRMWGSSIVGFGSYHYVYESGREGDWPLIGFSPRARNLALYIMPGFTLFEALMSRLGKHKTGKSCLYVNRLADIDFDVLRELAERSVALMRERYDCD